MANERPEHSSEFLIGEADFAGATFAEKANFRIAVFPEKADFAGATFTSDALFAYATCEPGTKRMILTTSIAYGPRLDSVIGETGRDATRDHSGHQAVKFLALPVVLGCAYAAEI
jgi:hypothetical protein